MPVVPSDRRKVSICLLLVILLVLSAQLQRFLQQYRDVAQTDQRAGVSDFLVYYVAGLVARQPVDRHLYYPVENPKDIFLGTIPQETPWGQIAKAQGFRKTLSFVYPPFAALVLEPLSLLNWQLSLLFWRIILTALLLVSIYLVLLLTEADHVLLRFVLSSAAALSFFPMIETLFQGQIDPIILLVWVGGACLIKVNRPVWSALCFAVGTMLKVSPIVAVGLFLLRRQWKWLFSYVGWMVLLLGLSVWRLGWENHVVWLSQILPQLSCGVAFYPNKSLAGLVYDLYLGQVPALTYYRIPAYICTVAKVAGALLYFGTLFFFWWKNKVSTTIAYELVMLSLLTVLISPVSWRHHCLLALLPLIYLSVKCGEAWRDLLVLAAATLAMGTVFPDYVIVALRNPVLDIALASLVPLTSLLLLLVLCANYAGLSWNRSRSS